MSGKQISYQGKSYALSDKSDTRVTTAGDTLYLEIDNESAASANERLAAEGYSVSYEHAVSGMDFTDQVLSSINDPEGEMSLTWLVTGYSSFDPDTKTGTLKVDTKENMDRIATKNATRKALGSKQDATSAWAAVEM